ncbi:MULTISPECIES: aldo/keto reductase [unclassified Streptomyces]|uniref:aldo/keto reductase n=1 Tax=unclassified Streptomyces TaxID=2593676 RepID=UPI003425FFD5
MFGVATQVGLGLPAAEYPGLGCQFGDAERVAAERGVSSQQVALAWLLARSPAVIPVPGASRPASIQDSAKAAETALSEAELVRLEGALQS